MPEKRQRFINPLLQPSAPIESEPDSKQEPPVEEKSMQEPATAPSTRRRLASQIKQTEQARDEEQPKEQMYRTTIYLSKTDLLLLDRYRARVFERTGNRIDRSEMIREAIKLYAQQHEDDEL